MKQRLPAATGLAALDAVTIGRMLRQGAVSAPEVLQAVLARIATVGQQTRSHVHVATEQAHTAAARAQARIDAARAACEQADLPAMIGIPVSLKGNLCVEGWEVTCGSRVLTGFYSPYDATVVRHLRLADAVLLGQTNLDEFAMGSTTESSCHATTANPHDLQRSPGGSSGGSAAAVAAAETYVALGSDTGGSVRQPAAYCGVVGLKPTYGAISRYGLIAYASSLDHVGTMGRTVADCAALFAAVAGPDPRDATAVCPHSAAAAALSAVRDHWGASRGAERYVADDTQPLRGLRIGLPQEYFCEGMQPAVEARVRQAAVLLEQLGARCETFSLPILAHGVAAFYVLACAEAASSLGRYDGIRYGRRAKGAQDVTDLYVRTRSEGFGLEVKRRLLLGNWVLHTARDETYFTRASRLRARMRRDLTAALSRFDLLLGPVSPTTAPLLGTSLDHPLQMYQRDICTVGANLAGLPALALPMGVDASGLPLGVQLIGPHFGEDMVLATAARLEAAWAKQEQKNHPLRPDDPAEVGG